MPSIQVRNVSSGTHAVLRRRAAERGLSLQEYLVALLDDIAAKPTVAEVLRRAGGRAGGRIGLQEAADELRADRDSR
ncbi:MAG: FitA-like ribbon-helix-helix domain-containing protein [Pseudonocardiaceae bacterium]